MASAPLISTAPIITVLLERSSLLREETKTIWYSWNTELKCRPTRRCRWRLLCGRRIVFFGVGIRKGASLLLSCKIKIRHLEPERFEPQVESRYSLSATPRNLSANVMRTRVKESRGMATRQGILHFKQPLVAGHQRKYIKCKSIARVPSGERPTCVAANEKVQCVPFPVRIHFYEVRFL